MTGVEYPYDELEMRMSNDGTPQSTPYCSFCGKSEHNVRKLVAGPLVLSAMNAWSSP